MTKAEKNLIAKMEEAETKAWKSLAGYKFSQFGYWCAIWVHLNQVGEFKKPNPFQALTKVAKTKIALDVDAKQLITSYVWSGGRN